ncbi:MAG TPA: ABC transporter permease [Bryobacteraceae bacterium]|jgi:lipoprotein-releasing system permease protein|nr:ABC transporter permease [Bryobacteraceae bacterium]
MFELFIARRYLRAKRKQVVISVITFISVAGVAAGVMALVIALAINNGFKNTLERDLLGATAHVSILEKEQGAGIENWEELAQKLGKLPHVVSATPGLYESAYMRGPVQSDGVEIKGVKVAPGSPLPDALKHLKAGSADGLMSSDDDWPGIILGSRLAQTIGAVNGKTVDILTTDFLPSGPLPRYKTARVVGIFEIGFFDVDSHWAYMALPAEQKMFSLTDVVSSIDIMLDDIYAADEVQHAAEAIIGPKLGASTWKEQYRQILGALKIERIVTAITIGLIQFVAGLNILITLVMMVMEKHRDISILMSMGARASQIRNIFVFEGALIGAAGTLIGLVAGYTLCYFLDHYKLIPLDEQVYTLPYVPFNPQAFDGFWIAGAAMAVSLLATLYPARNATRIAPVEALRYE